MANTEYITKPGDRWDLIAYRAYGTLNMIVDDDGNLVSPMAIVIQQNPDISVTDIIPEGLLLQIPIIVSATPQTDLSLLPPWKTN
jgi:phage tail protein X